MTPELIKELQVAGFPLKAISVEELKARGRLDDFEAVNENSWIKSPTSWGYYKIPTLSELIAECGDGFSHLLRIYVGDKVRWIAVPVGDNINILPPRVRLFDYSTPEEAVAKLWLALTKKDNETS